MIETRLRSMFWYEGCNCLVLGVTENQAFLNRPLIRRKNDFVLEESTPSARLSSHYASEKHYFVTPNLIAKTQCL